MPVIAPCVAAAPSQQQPAGKGLVQASQAAASLPGAWTDPLAGTSFAQLGQATEEGGLRSGLCRA
jgi:hypothetical protein